LEDIFEMIDLSYLTTEYARNKTVEQYNQEAKEHAEIHRECDEYRVLHGEKPVGNEAEERESK
jgi:hypothetical protein